MNPVLSRRSLVTIALAGVLLTGCDAPQPKAGNTVLVLSNVANSPQTTLSPFMLDSIVSTVVGRGTVGLVLLGNGVVKLPEVKLKEAKPYNEDRARQLAALIVKLTKQQPNKDGADWLESILTGLEFLRDKTLPRTMFVTGSGLSDRGLLPLTVPGMLDADPDEVAEALKPKLPDMAGVTIKWWGVGFTRAPQEELSAFYRQAVRNLYKAVLEKAGAKVEFDSTPPTAEAVVTTFKVTPIPISKPKAPEVCKTTTVTFSATALTFRPDATEFSSPDEARKALAESIAWLREKPSRTVSVIGATARAMSREYQMTLSRGRAERVAGLLRDAGVAPTQVISVLGEGSYGPTYEPDQLPSGKLDLGPAARNRNVRLVLTDRC